MSETLIALLSEASWLSIVVAYVGGLLTFATPCVLPAVSLTLGLLGVTPEQRRTRAFALSACYALGIVIAFTALGLFFGMSGKVFGSLLAHPATSAGIACVFLLLAAASFDLYHLQIPSSVAVRLHTWNAGMGGWIGAMCAGVFAGAFALPCVGPVLIAILTLLGTSGQAEFAAGLMACYALGFATPFVLIGTFALRAPRSGPWLHVVKTIFGVMLLVGAFWFLRTLHPSLRMVMHSGWVVLLAVFGIVSSFLWAVSHSVSFRRAGKVTSIACVTGLMIFQLNTLLAPQTTSWCEQSTQMDCLREACAEHVVTIVDFTAVWCVSCVELEHRVLSDARVQERMSAYGRVRVDYDANESIVNRMGVSGLPAVLFLDQTCKPVGERISGLLSVEEFLSHLDHAVAKGSASRALTLNVQE